MLERTIRVGYTYGAYHVTRRIEIPEGTPLTKWLFLSDGEKKDYENTPFTANGTGECSQCGEKLATEADFAKHFIIDDIRYLNLGHCPNKKD